MTSTTKVHQGVVDKTVEEKLAAAQLEWERDTKEQLRLARIKCDQDYMVQLEEKIRYRLSDEKVIGWIDPKVGEKVTRPSFIH